MFEKQELKYARCCFPNSCRLTVTLRLTCNISEVKQSQCVHLANISQTSCVQTSPSSSGLIHLSPCFPRLWHPLMCILLNYFFMSCSLFSSWGNCLPTSPTPPPPHPVIPIHLRWPCLIGTHCCSAPTSPCFNPSRPTVCLCLCMYGAA